MSFESHYTPKDEANPGFIKKKYGNLHVSPEVEAASRRTEVREGVKIEKPNDKIQNYLDRFNEILSRENEDERNRGIKALKKVMIDQLVINPENVPERAFVLEQEIREQQGHGKIEITEDFKKSKIEQIREDQIHSLVPWINYLSSPDADYPDWAKYWAFRSASQMGKYNKEKKSFDKRDKSTVASFPTLNAGCLAETIGKIQKHLEISNLSKNDPLRKEKEQELMKILKDDKDARNLIMSENFSKIYANELEKFGGLTWENIENIRGVWKTYKQGSEPDELVQSLKGYPLEWCTKNESTARGQLQGGDFHVYYSEDNTGKAVVPRLAIRMSGKNIQEIRGVEKGQNIDQYIQPILDNKLKEYGNEGQIYLEKLRDMKKMTEATRKHRHGEPLLADDLRFLYEIDGKIKGFGYSADPRLEEVKNGRNWKTDMSVIFETKDDTDLVNKLIDSGHVHNVSKYLDKFEGLVYDTNLEDKFISVGQLLLVINNLDKFENINHNETVNKLIKAGGASDVINNLDKFEDLVFNTDLANNLIESGQGVWVINNLGKFSDINHNNLVNKLIKAGCVDAVVKNFQLFKGLSGELAISFVEEGKDDFVFENINSFESFPEELAILLIKKDETRITNLLHFKDKIEFNNFKDFVIKMVSAFSGIRLPLDFFEELKLNNEINMMELVDLLIDKHAFMQGALQALPELHCEYVYETLRKNNKNYIILYNLDKFKHISKIEHIILYIKSENHFSFYDIKDLLPTLSNEEQNIVAHELLKAGLDDKFIEHIKEFKYFDQSIVEKIIDIGEFSKIKYKVFDLDHVYDQRLLHKIIDNFDHLDNHAVNSLYKKGYIDNEVALKITDLIGGHYGPQTGIYSILSAVENIDHATVLEKIFSKYYQSDTEIRKPVKLNQELAEILINSRANQLLLDFLDRFEDVDYAKILDQVFENPVSIIMYSSEHDGPFPPGELRGYLHKFKNLRIDQANKLIELNAFDEVTYSIGSFNESDHSKIMDTLIKQVGRKDVDWIKNSRLLENINKFSNIDQSQVVLQILKYFSSDRTGRWFWSKPRIDSCTDLGIEVAEEMIKKGFLDQVVINLKSFRDEDIPQIVKKAIDSNVGFNIEIYDFLSKEQKQNFFDKAFEQGKLDVLVSNMDKFVDIDFDKELFVDKALELGFYSDTFMTNLLKIQGLRKESLLGKIIKSNHYSRNMAVINNLEDWVDSFSEEIIDHLFESDEYRIAIMKKLNILNRDHLKYMANKLAEIGEEEILVDNLGSFRELGSDLARNLISKNYSWAVARNMKSFEDLDQVEIVSKIVESGQGWYVLENIQSFQDVDSKKLDEWFMNSSDYNKNFYLQKIKLPRGLST